MASFQEKVYPVRKSKKVSNKKEKSKFSNGVYKIVKKIPRGEVLNYKQVARAVGLPRAFRAVGNALNKNTDIKIPCHRVVKSNGSVGGYRHGQKKKIALLRKEGIMIYHGKVTS